MATTNRPAPTPASPTRMSRPANTVLPGSPLHTGNSNNLPGSPPRPVNPMVRPVAYPGGVPRSLSLSPTHLMGRSRHRVDAAPGSMLVPAPGMPFLDGPPSLSSEVPVRFSEHQKAMEHAVAAERKRAKEMEEQEKDLSADELRKILKQERHRMARFARTIADLKSTAVQCQSEAEIHEEGRINSLLGRLETMQIEKGRIVNELEREEEMLTNTLQKKLDQVKREKLELERLIEREQMSHTNLQSKLTGLQSSAAQPAVTGISDESTNTNTGSRMLTALDEGEDEDDDDEDTNLDAVLPDLAAIHEASS